LDRFHRLFYPQVPAVLTASHVDGVGALLATSVMPVSLKPAYIATALAKTHRTTRLVENSNSFCVCWVSYEQVDIVEKLSEPTPEKASDKLKACGIEYFLSPVVEAPVLAGSKAWIECFVEWFRDVGDHVLFLAKVISAYAVEDFNEYWRFAEYKPILYVGQARENWSRFIRFPYE